MYSWRADNCLVYSSAKVCRLALDNSAFPGNQRFNLKSFRTVTPYTGYRPLSVTISHFFPQSFADFHFVEDMSHIYAPNQGYPSSSICPTQPKPLDSPLTPHFSECFFYASVLVEHESWLTHEMPQSVASSLMLRLEHREYSLGLQGVAQ